ncbi:thiamine thiazole synthase, chloroplastic-like [Hibiscus syriacus]|nr:thiamine thiazole synthase, chloroplastic-like [Hibiscus syriacus]
MSNLLARPNVKLFNAVAAEDLIVNDGRVGGIETNWALVSMNHDVESDTQSCMDPNVMEAKVVVSSCGHDGPFGATGVKRLKSIGMIDSVSGMKALDMNTAEDAIVTLTREIVPRMIVTGMEVAEINGSPRIGPTFGAMMISGQKAAHLALKALGLPNALDGTYPGSIHPELILAAAVSAETANA